VRNHYYNDAELSIFEADDRDELRGVVASLRELAREFLLVRMREAGRKYLQAEWTEDLPVILWKAVLHGPKVMDPDEVEDLEQLSQIAGGWWHSDSVNKEPAFLTLAEWSVLYAER